MSSALILAETDERIEISQIGQETLLLAPVVGPCLRIAQEGGDHIKFQATTHNLILSETNRQTMIIHAHGGDTLQIGQSDQIGVSPLYGKPYTSADDGALYYFAWQHVDGSQWKAQRFELATLDLATVTGANPQPETLADFQNLNF